MRWTYLVAALLTAGLVGPGALASEKMKDPIAWEPLDYIQMLPMMVPAGSTVVPITFFL
ncbi:MAG: hypothetical protein VW405_12220 [Rhodospirillaceae bacterium]